MENFRKIVSEVGNGLLEESSGSYGQLSVCLRSHLEINLHLRLVDRNVQIKATSYLDIVATQEVFVDENKRNGDPPVELKLKEPWPRNRSDSPVGRHNERNNQIFPEQGFLGTCRHSSWLTQRTDKLIEVYCHLDETI